MGSELSPVRFTLSALNWQYISSLPERDGRGHAVSATTTSPFSPMPSLSSR